MFRLAIDPGVTCGVAWREYEDIEVTAFGEDKATFVPGVGHIHAIQWPGSSLTVVLDGFEVAYGDDFGEVVIENFQSRPGPAVNLTPVEVIGEVVGWAAQRGMPVVRQNPAPVKVRVTNDRLRAMGGWFRSQPHARDAARHLLYREEKAGELQLSA